MKTSSKRRWSWRNLAILALLTVGVVSCLLLVRDLRRSAREQAANQRLAQQVREQPPPPAPVSDNEEAPPEEPLYAPSGNLLRYDALWQENQDLAGWLAIPGTDTDLPVMFTPADPEYYLHRGFDGGYAASGSLFLGEDWDPEANHAIIYGHNMKNGTMFGRLKAYRDAAYAQEHPVIRFDTLKEEGEYQVLAAFYSRVYNQNDQGVFRYYQYTDLSRQETFEEYVRRAKSAALYDTGVEAQYGDRLLTLSTCSYHRDKGRFVVVACQKAAPETPADQEADAAG